MKKNGGRKSRWTVPLKYPAYLWDFSFIVLRLGFCWTVPLKHRAYLWGFLFIVLRFSVCLGHIFEKIVWTILKKVNMETVKASTKTLI